MLVRNCQGANGNNFSHIMLCFAEQYKPKILVLLDLRISGIEADRVVTGLGFDSSHRIEADGFARGIWILWKEVVGISILHNDMQFVHMVVSSPSRNSFLFTVVYGSPNFRGR